MKPLTLGILGGGQLGQMLALAGFPLGVRCRVYEPASTPPCTGIAEVEQGRFDDPEQLAQFVAGVSAVTYEFENIPTASLQAITARVPLFPPLRALHVSQDRLVEKQFFNGLGIPTSPYASVETLQDLEQASRQLGFPCILKTRRLGYDGKGQVLLRDAQELATAYQALGGRDLILEGYVKFDRELSVIAVRGRSGEQRFYDLTENHHAHGILRTSLAPAPAQTPQLLQAAHDIARKTLESLDYVGVLAIELFQVGDRLLVNEMAPRVHNSGHWTMEGAVTSQFENHIRAVLGLPLGATNARGFAVMKNLIGTAPDTARLLAVPGAALHLYGKAPQPGRKLGHVTVVASDAEAARLARHQLDEACG